MSMQSPEVSFVEQVKALAQNSDTFYDSARQETFRICSVEDTYFCMVALFGLEDDMEKIPYDSVQKDDKFFILQEIKYSHAKYVFVNDDGNYVREKHDGTYFIDPISIDCKQVVVAKGHEISTMMNIFPSQFYDRAGNPVGSVIKALLVQ